MAGPPPRAFVGLILIFACTWPIDLTLALQSRGLLPFAVPQFLGPLVGYGVVIGALLASALEGGGSLRALVRRFAIWRIGPAWYAAALLGVPAAYVAALALAVAIGGPTPDFSAPYVTRFVPAGLALWAVVPAWFAYEILTNGEEVGWRGYLLPRLQTRYAPLLATALVATAWGIWHLPKFLVVPTVYDYPLWLWAVDLLAKAVLLTWLFNRSGGSLLLVTLFHASYNTAALTLPILPVVHGDATPFTIAVALLAAWAVVVVLADRELGASRAATAAPPSSAARATSASAP